MAWNSTATFGFRKEQWIPTQVWSSFPPRTARTIKQHIGLSGIKLVKTTWSDCESRATMQNAEDAKRKLDLLEDNQMDSGVESFQSLMKDDPFIKTDRDSTSEPSEARDKLTITSTEERLDSAYGSSSLNVESLSEIIGGCNISKSKDDSAENTECSEHEENLLTTITEDGDTYVFYLPLFK